MFPFFLCRLMGFFLFPSPALKPRYNLKARVSIDFGWLLGIGFPSGTGGWVRSEGCIWGCVRRGRKRHLYFSRNKRFFPIHCPAHTSRWFPSLFRLLKDLPPEVLIPAGLILFFLFHHKASPLLLWYASILHSCRGNFASVSFLRLFYRPFHSRLK